jgi:hypothetical protein
VNKKKENVQMTEEEKDIEYGNKKYPGIGFVYEL